MIPFLAVLMLAITSTGFAQDTISLDDLVKQGEQWLKENVDEKWLESLQGTNQEQVRQFVGSLQKRLQGRYVLDLASLKTNASIVLPLLESYEETKPYASWLRARMDYLDAADQFQLLVPPPKGELGEPPQAPPNPAPELERKVWEKQLAVRPPLTGSAAYAARLKPIFREQHIPPELVWLAEIESSFDPRARSPVGATGLFQLMPGTAKENGLAMRPTDERLDPEKNTRAAAIYLKHLHARFGNWPLALAAYNAGEGRIQNLIEKQKTRTFTRIAPKLPAETQMYVPRFEATLRRREGMTMAQLEGKEP